MFGDVQIAPSLLSADFMNLERDVQLLAGAEPAPEWLHVDVMDGHFVPNLTIGPPVIKSLKKITNIPLDVHLMIDNPEQQLDWYIDAGADLITVHLEADSRVAEPPRRPGTSLSVERVDDPSRIIGLIARIHAAGLLAGISLNPNTPAEAAFRFLNLAELVLVMSVHPGFGGQRFIKGSIGKVAALAAEAKRIGANPLIEVDGGINAQTAPLVVDQGADVLVAGNAVLAAADPIAALEEIRQAVL
ncbi:MAG: ribulose-phosphate 3-epimerase [Coriobacteriales bacterium]|jgi:ribulose-phosphate 3-epimerase|nr:ribulose-phosphate 3-epimerase [Coriobacteriales bacterium]